MRNPCTEDDHDLTKKRKHHQPTGLPKGRPPNSLNKMTQQAREAAKLEGRMPHEILLDAARGKPMTVYKPQPDGTMKAELEPVSLAQALDAAKAAAPFYAPKISTVEVVGNLDDATLNSLLERTAAEAGVAIAPSREGEEGSALEGDEAAGEVAPARTRRRLLREPE
jgi:hypothetical protein